MKYVTTIQQADALKKRGFVELESLFTIEEVKTLHNLLDHALASHLGILPEKLSATFPQQRLASGYGLHLDNPSLKKALKLSKFGKIGTTLFRERHLCLAFIQYFPCYPRAATLKEINSLTETVGGALLGLTSSQSSFAPKNIGNVVFFQPNLVLPFPQFDFPLLLLAFTNDKARYIHQPSDPHTHFLKKIGYAFGDKLTKETHPLIFRE